MDFRERSKEYLTNEFKDCFHDFFVSVLDRGEKILRVNKGGSEWKEFRFTIMNLGNDYIRKVDSILKEYDVEFRPFIFRVEYSNRGNKIEENKIISLDFGFTDNIPYFRIISKNIDLKGDLLDLQEALGCGKVSNDATGLTFNINGMYDIFHKLIPFIVNNNIVKGSALERFNKWKEEVYILEGKGYAKKIT